MALDKIKSEPTTREERRPVLDAARKENSKEIDVALASLTDGQIENIKDLCRAEWAEILGRNLMLLSERIDALSTTKQDAHNKAVQASNTPTARPSTPAPSRPISPPPAQGPARGTRTTPSVSQQTTRVAEGMHR